jgi:rod shape-determining protein MreB
VSHDIAIDLGTANTLVLVKDEGIVANEPSVVAVNASTGETLAVGAEAKELIGRTPSHIRAMRPLRDGVVTHLRITEEMLRYFIGKARRGFPLPRPRVVVAVPSGITEVEQQAVEHAVRKAGGRRAYTMEESMAAAIGAGLPVQEPVGIAMVDIGGGTTEVAVISFGGIVTSSSLRVGGDELDQAIVAHVKKHHSMAIGERSAEEVKVAIGSAAPVVDEATVSISGRDLVTGLPKAIELSGREIREAIAEPVEQIVDTVRATLDACPPELAGDVINQGIVLAGGVALLKGLQERLREATSVPVHVPEDPLTCVVEGAGKCLQEFAALKRVLTTSARGPWG